MAERRVENYIFARLWSRRPSVALGRRGYFEVMKNEEVPFEVDTKNLNDLRVVGTKFNFRNYPDDEEVTVNLMEGKVALRNGIREMPELYLTPDEENGS